MEKETVKAQVLGERGSRKTTLLLLPGLVNQPKTRRPLTEEEKLSQRLKVGVRNQRLLGGGE